MKSFVVIGMGRFGESVALSLTDLGHEVLIIDKDEQKIQNLSDQVTHAVIADAKDERTLKALGVRNYDCAILTIGYDVADSVLITLALKDLGVPEVICKARDARHKKILEKIGANRVIIPEQEAGNKLAIHLSQLNLLEFLKLDERYGLSEMLVPARWKGKTLMQVDLRRNYNLTVVAVKKVREDADIVVGPGGDYQFEDGDLLVVVGSNEDITELSHLEK